MQQAHIAPRALLPSGWANDVFIEITDGNITAVRPTSDRSAAPMLAGPVVSGITNVHSHAFQRAMAGLAEVASRPDDDFWSWRNLMYKIANALTPEHLYAIARYLYIEMLKAGYTTVCEFHYIHHDRDGRSFSDPGEMSHRLVAAANDAGIAMTLLPTFYAHSAFGGAPPLLEQRRFVLSVDKYLRLEETLAAVCVAPDLRLGACLHSLRAVTPDEILQILSTTKAHLKHIHIAEQQKEVEDCIAWSGERPIAWLMSHTKVDSSWCLVHATHADDAEIAALAQGGAVVGLCPSTEANLGDGIFAATTLFAKNGAFGIGSDSHVSVSPAEELRWLEYGQRLQVHKRNRLHTKASPSIAGAVFRAALRGGARAAAQNRGRIEVGARADLVVLDGDHPLLSNVEGDDILGRWIFALGDAAVRDVMVGGAWRVKERHHAQEDAAASAFAETLKAL